MAFGSPERSPPPCPVTQPSVSLAVEALLIAALPGHFSESCWTAVAAINPACSSHMHSRWGLRPLAARLTSHLEDRGPRRRVWRRLCLGAMDLGASAGVSAYSALAATESPSDAQIRRDIGRTFPEAFDEDANEALFRVLRAASHRLEDIGYCQGMNFLAGIFLRVFCESGDAGASPAAVAAAEAVVYQCVLSILLRHGMNQYYGDRFPKLRLTALQFDCLLETYLPELADRFNSFNLSAEFYATQWFLTLFSFLLPFEHVLRVWDHFLCRGMKHIHRVGLALLHEARPRLMKLGFDATLTELRNVGHDVAQHISAEELVERALSFKVTNHILIDLERAIIDHGRPQCFLERDLDSGRTRLHVLPPGSGLPATTATAAAEGLPSSSTSGRVRWRRKKKKHLAEAALPAPRLPEDPSMPRMSWEPPEADHCSSPSGDKASRQKRLQKWAAASLRTVRPAALRRSAGGGKESSAAASSRSSSVPTARRAEAGDDGAGLNGLGSSLDSQLQSFVIKDLDTGRCTVLEGAEASASGQTTSSCSAAPSSKKSRSWASSAQRMIGRRSSSTSRATAKDYGSPGTNGGYKDLHKGDALLVPPGQLPATRAALGGGYGGASVAASDNAPAAANGDAQQCALETPPKDAAPRRKPRWELRTE
eukprot:TRINITY_DN45934_c0_g1_i2.p1 TRINITY_DN45934_c0_g1~~TRINITY_DN45934_c0_g1_i2.p1  ORF type:complete len:653 (-),score=145.60 TRINITY_DN45934_c0_g1_i2:10-1968(-)